jgi:tetratricopeptide (TPR) repeat protein
MRRISFTLLACLCLISVRAQINTDRVLTIGRNALYFEDYVLSIQYFNQVIRSKPWLAEPYFYRAVAKINLDDFKGAEEDCSLCLARNPFLTQAYFARGIARHSQDNFDGAISDYAKGLELKKEDRQMLSNQALAFIQKKDYTGANKVFDELLTAYPKYAAAYLTRGSMHIELGDTAAALQDYNRSIELDPYYPPAYGNRAIIYYQTNKMKDALADLNEAIRLNTREPGYYINRGLVRYHINDLRGAMSDYDQVIEMNPRNKIARFNRGLLRAQVGDDNRAIEDFDIVLQEEPDNFMAYYNRALLKSETGDYLGAVHDFTVVLERYPDFTPGYYSRADARRKMKDNAGADRDAWTAYQIEERISKEKQSGTTQKDPADPNPTTTTTREESDQSISKFNRLVVYDKDEERKSTYQNDIRGRVQDRNVRVDLETQFILSYYEKATAIRKGLHYDKSIEDYNSGSPLTRKLIITNEEAPLSEDQISAHFTSIDNYSAAIAQDPQNPTPYFGRAIDYTLVQDFSEALRDYTAAIERDTAFANAYFNRAAVRYKQLEYDQSQSPTNTTQYTEDYRITLNITTGKVKNSPTATPLPDTKVKDSHRAIEHDMILRDYNKVIELNPGFIYAYFNRGNLLCAQHDFRAAILDYNEAILRDPDFAEAYFNRGLARLSLGDASRGIADLSKAGELGIINSYSIIKRMTNE